MASLVTKIEPEFENSEKVLEKLAETKDLPYLSPQELVGTAALVNNLYKGIENILRQIIKSKSKTIPSGKSWHEVK